MDATQDSLSLDGFQHRPADFLARPRESGRPVVLTVDGEPALVVQDAESYRKLQDAAVEGIRRGLEDVRAGLTQPLAEAFERIRRDCHGGHAHASFPTSLASRGVRA